MSAPPPPSPQHLLRSHSAQLAALSFSPDNERIYSGDASGLVVVTSTRSLRAIASWRAHTDGLLGVQEWEDYVITHGRDNKLHVWSRIEELPPSRRLGGSAALPGLTAPKLRYSMDVNALNYCRFSLLDISGNRQRNESDTGERAEAQALIALPNLVESSLADIWSLPSCQRIHAAIGTPKSGSIFSSDRTGESGPNSTGIIMSLHVFKATVPHPHTSSPSHSTQELRLLCAYENGSVELRRYVGSGKETSVEGKGWEVVWSVKLHVDAIMAMCVSQDNTFALTVSADHIVGRYDLAIPHSSDNQEGTPSNATAHRTKHPGNGSIAIRDDGRVCAVGGWDGKIRLYSTRTFKPLGTLSYHKTGCQALVFARTLDAVKAKDNEDNEDDEDEEMTEEQKRSRARWLISGGKDCRVSVWALLSFEKNR